MQNVFKRVEQKYILTEYQYNLLQEIIDKYFNKDVYYKSKIYNIYFDNDNNDLMINSIEKPVFKKKIRVRSYGKPMKDDIVFFEIKDKYKGVVYKRRVRLTLREYNNYINRGILPKGNKQIMREVDYYINYYKIHPCIFVGYDRLSYYSKEDKNFRITFDSNLRSRFINLSLKDTKDNKIYFDNREYIMEVKSLMGLPPWFKNYLLENKIYPRSFSKVGSIYKKEKEKYLC